MFFFSEVTVTVIIILNNCRSILNDKIDKNTNSDRRYNADRFVQDLDDEEWHVSHLKYVDLDGRRDCVGETFKDKARRYKETLRNDGALVKYVSVEPIPFNESNLITDNCKLEMETLTNYDKLEKQKFTPFITENPTAVGESLMMSDDPLIITETPNPDKVVNTTKTNKVNLVTPITQDIRPKGELKATPATVKQEKEMSDKGNKDEKTRRGSEYVFSSVEYYDEVPTFDETICPDAVEVIELEIDQLRSYDIECERITEWRSLD